MWLYGDWNLGPCRPWRVVSVVVGALLALWDLQGAVATEVVYFNSYGDCNQQDYPLADEVYSLQATGARELHETLICEMTFKAPAGMGVCMTFDNFRIDDCGVTLIIYQEPTAAGKQWKKLTCDNINPAQMCTPERYITLKLQKRKLNKNRNYQFSILVKKSSNLTGEDVILASSIGLFVGIIGGVVALIVILAVIVLCCCCRPCKSQQAGCKAAGGASCSHGVAGTTPLQPVLPTAPPAIEIEDESTPLQTGPGGPLYPALPHHYPGRYGVPEPPPPYEPPPYEQHSYPTKGCSED